MLSSFFAIKLDNFFVFRLGEASAAGKSNSFSRRSSRTCHCYLVVSLNSVDWRKEGVHVCLIPKGAIPR